MSKHYFKSRRIKSLMLAFACTAAFSMTGIAAACSTTDDSAEDETPASTTKEDTQLLKNGNFEFFTVPDDAVYLISDPLNWSNGGSSSYVKSGIIGTSETAWAALTDENLADKLDYNNDLDSDDSDYEDNYVDYNGMKSSDIPYKDTYAVLNPEDDAETDASKQFIDNPGTHYNVQKKSDGSLYYLDNGNEVAVYEDENGDYFLDEDFKEPISHVLMIHNYATNHFGLSQYYSSVSVDLPANTAAEISFWVKTSELSFQKGTKVSQDRGAFFSVTHTVGSTTLDDFSITDINTEKLIAEEKASADYGGWVEYTVYVNACDFASSTITLKLGLGDENNVEGYAFFDDVSVTKFLSLDDADCSYGDYAAELEADYSVNSGSKIITRNAYSTLLSDASNKVFPADSYSRNEGTVYADRFSECFHYLLDLSSASEYEKSYGLSNLKAGLTVDSDKYVSSTSTDFKVIGGIAPSDMTDVRLPSGFASLNTASDLIAFVKTTDSPFTAADTEYSERLNAALKSAASLPRADENSDMLVMLSAYGAAYTSSIELTVEQNGYQIVSFWLKTADQSGNTTATINIKENGNDDNTGTLSVNTKGVTTDIDDDNKDVYDGWVQCFFFVNNETDETKTYTIDFCLGNTTIKGTSVNSYTGGWIALANMQTLKVDEDTFAYTGSGSYTASLTISDEEELKNSVFDEAYGSQANKIESGIATPSSYNGVNGGSSFVVKSEGVSLPFDEINDNPYAGLINAEYVENYAESGADWYAKLLNGFNITDTSTTNALTAWNEIFGKTSVQPLIIVNTLRDSYILTKEATQSNYSNYYVKDDNGNYVTAEGTEYNPDETYYSLIKVMNYGYIGSDKTLSADSCTTVSVKVKVSEGAVAYVYLTETSAGKSILSFTAPSFTFRYDEDGNVLKSELKDNATLAEQRANILYTLRDDGLYEDENGDLFANIWNYTKLYKDESADYYDAEGNRISFENLADGETYYSDENATVIANHFLVTTDGTKVYEYRDGDYYYMVEGAAKDKVTPFDTAYARYDYSALSEEYAVVIDGNDPDVAGKWITVNFVIKTGSESKSYRLELWSGSRESTGVNADGTAQYAEGASVLFDYSYTSVTSSNYDTLLSEYESDVIEAYRSLLASHGLLSGIASSSENISYYENLVKGYIADGTISESELDGYEILKTYKAYYYTYTLYDSANFRPFNQETAEDNEIGYEYSVNDYSEALAYLSIKESDSYTVFADYATVDQSISISTSSEDEEEAVDEDTETDTTVWLLISSIVLAVVLLLTLLLIFIRDLIKKLHLNRKINKNNYNFQKRNRYIRKLRIKEEQFEEVENPVKETENPTKDEDKDE